MRACVFLASNLRAGRHQALRAALVESAYAIVVAGLLGAAIQRLRFALPERFTGLLIWLGFPTVMVLGPAGVHHLAGTPHVRAGLLVSFALADFASGFALYAQRRGLLLAGDAAPGSLLRDLRDVPPVLWAFLREPFGERGETGLQGLEEGPLRERLEGEGVSSETPSP